MANQVSLFQQENALSVLSNKFQPLVQAGLGDDLGEGIKGGYAIVGIKGGRFHLRYKGNDTVLTAQQQPGQPAGPVSFIDIVIIKYAEGSKEQPDCFSLDGKAPSAQSREPQHTSCALCPQNKFGSMIGDNGKPQKACRDTKKLAIVPLADIRNISLGGTMLFRVPPSSLSELSAMADALKGRGFPYNSVAVRITFDTTVSHPKPLFQALRPLSDAEADAVIEMFEADSTQRVLADNDISTEVAEPASAQFIQPTPVASPIAAAQQQQPAPVPASAPQAVMPGMVAIQPFKPGVEPQPPRAFHQPTAVPVGNVFAQTPVPAGAQETVVEPPKKRRAPVTPVASPATLQLAPEQPAAAQDQMLAEPQGSLEADIGNILAGLSAFQK
jgi:hypothetical protein